LGNMGSALLTVSSQNGPGGFYDKFTCTKRANHRIDARVKAVVHFISSLR